MRALIKDIVRQVKGTFGRFLSIAIISMLGVGSFAGLRSVSPDMQLTADLYYAEHDLMDLYVVSTLGFSENDMAAIEREGLLVMPSYAMDALARVGNSGELAAKVYAVQESDPINRLDIEHGRLPEAAGECVLDHRLMSGLGAKVGDTLTLASGKEDPITDTLVAAEFTIVGEVVSPMYVSFEYGGSTVGDGEARGALFLHPDAFDLEVYTAVFIAADATRGVRGSTEEYDRAVDAALNELKITADIREQERYDEIMDEAGEKIADAEAELADGERERDEKIADAQKTIDDAKEKLADGEKELADGRARFNREIRDAERKLADGELEITDGQREIYENMQKLDDGEKEIADGWKEIAENEQKLVDGEKEMEDGRRKLESAGSEIESARLKLETGKQGLDQLAGAIEMMKLDPTTPPAMIAAMQQQYDDLNAQYQAGVSEYESGAREYSQAVRDYESGVVEYMDGKRKLEEGKAELYDAEREIVDGRQKLAEGLADIEQAQKDLAQGRIDLEKARRDGEKELVDGEQEIEDAKVELADGERELREKEIETAKTIADAHAELDDAKEELAKVEKPVWHFFTRDDLPAHREYYEDADKVAAIGTVFPLVFFAVAVLISLTTMSRMVDEQRAVIGTMKMLGYERGAIAMKYVIYAFLSSALGCSGGLALGRYFFPSVVAGAYGMKYYFPPLIMPFQWAPSMGALISCMVLIVGAAYFAVRRELMEEPAQLLRPKAPKPGKRILLERIGPLWRRLPFSWKVTARNVFRYKSRFIMTIAGIAGCTALLATGFGLKDSLNAVPQNQFDRIWHYDLLVASEPEKLPGGREGLDAMLIGEGASDIAWWHQEAVTIRAGEGGHKLDASLIVPEKPDELRKLITLQTYPRGEPIAWEEGAVITYKVGKLLGVGAGDELIVADADNVAHKVTVAAVTEQYIGHYIYLPEKDFLAMDGDAEWNVVAMMLPDTSAMKQSELGTRLTATKGVLAQDFTSSRRESVTDMFGQLNVIVFVLIVAAGALALAVLFNLNNINIAERIRELATTKVLGFTQREVAAYVMRESVILTTIGIGVGLVAGIFLHRFVMSTAEIDMVVFGRSIEPMSFLYSILLTIAFTVIVSIAMLPKLSKIDMVESLKGVE